MTIRALLARITGQEDVNFLLTNRIPRRLLTRFAGWLSRVEWPPVRNVSFALWRLFSDLDLSDAKESHFKSLHACFTRELREGARTIDLDPGALISPCDAIIGTCGKIVGGDLIQVKGFRYTLQGLLGESNLVECYRNGRFVTLRLTSTMYHRFHAPHECLVEQVTHIPGDTWNVNPVALRRVEKLFCKNERAIIQTKLASSGHTVTLVPVGAILVASIRLHFVDVLLHMNYRGPRTIDCNVRLKKGEEMGWFEHGSTILVFAPDGFSLCETICEGNLIRMGQPLMHLPKST